MIYPYHIEGLPDQHAWLVGGLVNCEGTWVFHPVLKTFALRAGEKVYTPGAEAWHDLLRSSGCI
jgi:hypothetical protein